MGRPQRGCPAELSRSAAQNSGLATAARLHPDDGGFSEGCCCAFPDEMSGESTSVASWRQRKHHVCMVNIWGKFDARIDRAWIQAPYAESRCPVPVSRVRPLTRTYGQCKRRRSRALQRSPRWRCRLRRDQILITVTGHRIPPSSPSDTHELPKRDRLAQDSMQINTSLNPPLKKRSPPNDWPPISVPFDGFMSRPKHSESKPPVIDLRIEDHFNGNSQSPPLNTSVPRSYTPTN